MKKKLIGSLLTLAVVLLLGGCGDGSEELGTIIDSAVVESPKNEVVNASEDETEAEEVQEENETVEESIAQEPAEEENREGMYRSELTGEWISVELKNQRPIAAMVDNEVTALDHYGVNSADIVYEMMNSTANGRVTRLMVIYKDWQNITQLGSIRSARPTNFMVAAEYNAILCHDGGPFYINDYVAKKYTNNLSGGFARFSNGKSAEFTEYITYDSYTNAQKGKTYSGLGARIEAAKYSTEYNDYYPGEHFTFDYKGFDFQDRVEALTAETIKLPFPHNSSKLLYNSETEKYEYYEYGKAHVDPLDDNRITSFDNVILQSCSFKQYDDLGYMIYHVVGSGEGYYLTHGKAIPIRWNKTQEDGLTSFTDAATGESITLNVGKTYIGIVPSDKWNELVME